jgi:transcription elongation GreA/GreB family factor
MKQLFFTRKGLAKLDARISALTIRMKETQMETGGAAETGGNQWHDNASYDQLVIDTRGIDAQLAEAHDSRNHAVIVEPTSSAEKVAIGTTVEIYMDDEVYTWEIGGYGESEPEFGIIAYNTPLALLLMNKSAGDTVTGEIGGRKVKIDILEIYLPEPEPKTEKK